MHVIDIKHDIATGNVSGMRDAFAALAVPKWADIMDDKGRPLGPRGRAILLKGACDKLAGNRDIMPSELCAEFDLPAGSTYGEAVARVQAGADGERS